MIFELLDRLSLRCHGGLEVFQPLLEILVGGGHVLSQLLGLGALLRDRALETLQSLLEVGIAARHVCRQLLDLTLETHDVRLQQFERIRVIIDGIVGFQHELIVLGPLQVHAMHLGDKLDVRRLRWWCAGISNDLSARADASRTGTGSLR